MIPGAIYIFTTVMSALCAVLLLRSYRRSRLRLLLWSGAGFCAFVITNALLFLDLVVFTHTDLSLYREGSTLIGVGLLIYGLIWDSGNG